MLNVLHHPFTESLEFWHTDKMNEIEDQLGVFDEQLRALQAKN